MDALVFLKGIRAERMEISRLTEAREQLVDTLFPPAIRYDRDRVQTSPTDKMITVAAELDEIDRDIEQRIVKLSEDVRLAYQIVGQLKTPECREVIMLRYLMGKRRPLTWREIAQEMSYSVQHVKGKLHGAAVKELRAGWDEAEHPEK